MTQQTARASYEERINRVIAYVHDHLDDALDLDTLAGVACLSPFHWHRVYHGMTGETVAATVKRLRLHRAAGFLVQTDMPVQQVAARSGYPNVQSFTRIFSAVYGMPPAAYRRKGNHVQFDRPVNPQSTALHSVSIRQLPEMTGVGIDHSGSYLLIGRAFDQLFTTLAARRLLRPGMKSVGLYYDDPQCLDEDRLRSCACVISDAHIADDPPFRRISQPGGIYAVLRHKGPYSELDKAYQWLFGTWLPQSGYDAADIPCLEEYLNNPRDVPPRELLTDICIALTATQDTFKQEG